MSDPAALPNRLWGCWGMARLSLLGRWGRHHREEGGLEGWVSLHGQGREKDIPDLEAAEA